MTDLYEKLRELVPACILCGLPQYTVLSRIIAHKPDQWSLELCDVDWCTIHCRCFSN